MKLGKHHQYLEENFSPTPQNKVQVGHVLVFFLQCGKLYASTWQELKKRLDQSIAYTSHQLQTPVDSTLHFYRIISREGDMERFQKACQQRFEIFPAPP